jgi:uncharacterized protein (DUF488 family)
MCSEAVPWRCHRPIIADQLLTDDRPMTHIMVALEQATVNPGAVRRGALVYPPAADAELEQR